MPRWSGLARADDNRVEVGHDNVKYERNVALGLAAADQRITLDRRLDWEMTEPEIGPVSQLSQTPMRHGQRTGHIADLD